MSQVFIRRLSLSLSLEKIVPKTYVIKGGKIIDFPETHVIASLIDQAKKREREQDRKREERMSRKVRRGNKKGP